MIFSDHERKIIIASMQWAAMEWDKRSKVAASAGRRKDAIEAGAFSGECARIADLLAKGN